MEKFWIKLLRKRKSLYVALVATLGSASPALASKNSSPLACHHLVQNSSLTTANSYNADKWKIARSGHRVMFRLLEELEDFVERNGRKQFLQMVRDEPSFRAKKLVQTQPVFYNGRHHDLHSIRLNGDYRLIYLDTGDEIRFLEAGRNVTGH